MSEWPPPNCQQLRMSEVRAGMVLHNGRKIIASQPNSAHRDTHWELELEPIAGQVSGRIWDSADGTVWVWSEEKT